MKRSTDHGARRPALSLMRRGKWTIGLAFGVVAVLTATTLNAAASPSTADHGGDPGARLIAGGRQAFRFDTFGDHAFWGDTLHLHQAIAGAANGGVGPGVSPRTALSVGLKGDSTGLPGALKSGMRNGTVDLDAPAVTRTLLKLNAVVGVKGFFGRR